MAEKSTYLSRLEALKEKLQSLDATDCVAERLRLLGLLFEIEKVSLFFSEEAEKATSLYHLNIDNDINYDTWTKPSNWVPSLWLSQQNKENENSYLKKAWFSSSDLVYDIPSLKGYTKYLPTAIENSDYCYEAAADSIYNMFNVLSGRFANVAVIQYMIYQALGHLCEIISLLQKRLHNNRTNAEYKALGKTLYQQYIFIKGTAVASQFNELINSHSGVLDKDWFEDQLITQLGVLYRSKFMERVMRDTTRISATTAEVIYPIDDISNTSAKMFYCALNRICTFESGYFYFEDKEDVVAEYLHKNQRILTIDDQDSFFYFRRFAELIKTKMIDMGEPIRDIFSSSFNFSQSNISDRYDLRKVYSLLYTLVGNDKLINAKWHWYIVYLVLKSKHWLVSETATKFAEDICNTYSSISSDDLFKPNDENFKKVPSYYKDVDFMNWNNNDANAPSSCEEAIKIARTINSTFGREFLLPST